MYLTKTIAVVQYETKVQFIVTSDIARTINNIYKKHNISTRWTDAPSGTMVAIGLDKYRIIINEEWFSHNTILHELLHCVMCITFDRGIYEEEARCWLMGYIGQEIYNFLKEKKVNIQ